jgi:hypothetical protein
MDLWYRSISAGTKNSHFCITQMVSDPVAGTKDRLPADTTNYFCSSDWSYLISVLSSFSFYHVIHISLIIASKKKNTVFFRDIQEIFPKNQIRVFFVVSLYKTPFISDFECFTEGGGPSK